MNRIEKSKKLLGFYKYDTTRKIVPAKDGENIYVDFSFKTKQVDDKSSNMNDFEFIRKFDNSKILVIIPGACGTSGEFYLTDVMERFTQENFKCIAINHRGVLNYKLKNDKLYHTGYTEDMKDVFEFLSKNIKNSQYFVMGFSMGGNIVTKFLGENENCGSKYNIKGGCSVCGPLDLFKFNKLTEELDPIKIYSKFFCKNLKSIFNKNKNELTSSFSEKKKEDLNKKLAESVMASEFYTNYIFESFDFKSQEEYQRINSGARYVNRISIPYLSIFAEDDPLIPCDSIEQHQINKNENVVLAIAKSGGHVGFFKGLFFKRWIHEPIIDFIRDVAELK
eukprot:CAMPEP_0170519590 /NCGR_PEP_ID=MMETSP0209-20121228/4955_1 /TAXON_ID=665100 ORGANISM="Litonotus pictus, Strain P1" /NCGR_SAMPLE_ID=MMETSP0209 /ASSEMBLY_ACC=CAM_ASM_000301 /LENGTH=335 /DNA_ID=CAMNT_0010805521 /DNA_START=208 /DNA_END=1215 /DNA_ORIENTATION=+